MYNRRYVINQFLRLVEKLPFVNLNQTLRLHGKIYVLVPKAGTRTIRDEFLNHRALKKGEEWRYIHYVTRAQLRKMSKSNTVCVVLRDPLESLHSCWKQKILSQYADKDTFFYFWNYFPFIRRDMSFLAFLKVIRWLPSVMCEKHFRPLSVTVDLKGSDIHFIHLHELSSHLNRNEIVKISNATEKTIIPQDCVAYFNNNLRHRFRVTPK